jgi:signal transduction histidine kinase
MNLFQASSLILFVISFLLGLLVYLKDKKVRLNKLWFFFSFFVALWSLSLYFVTSSTDKTYALYWQNILDVAALEIPVAYFYFVRAFLRIENNKLFVYFVTILALVLAFFSFTPLFKVGVVKKFDFYWVDPGLLYFIFPIFFLSVILYSLFLLFRAYSRTKNDLLTKSQIKYQIIAGLIGFSGGATNFLPQLFNIFPFGSHLILLYISFVSYLILKYRLFNVKLILVEIALLVLNFFLFINIFLSHGRSILIFNVSVFLAILLFSALLLRGIYKDIRNRERIEALVKDMAVTNERLHVMEQSKTEFVSIASHQLRTPLTVIKGYASMILEGTFGQLLEGPHMAMANLAQASDKVVALVEDLLTVSRIEQGRVMLVQKPVNFVLFVEKTVGEMKNDIKDSGLELSITTEADRLSNMFWTMRSNTLQRRGRSRSTFPKMLLRKKFCLRCLTLEQG